MLRITVVETDLEEKWTLQGTLTGISIAELIANWKASRERQPKRRRIVDLDEVTSIDKTGEAALSMMIQDGASLVASGVYTKHLLEELKVREARTSTVQQSKPI